MRLNLDKIAHTIHCYYPASGQKYFESLLSCAAYKKHITIEPHPITEAGIIRRILISDKLSLSQP